MMCFTGTLDFEEFMSISKAEIELLEFEEQHHETESTKELLSQAAHTGVRFVRTASVSTDVKLQGSLFANSAASIIKRKELKDNEALVDCVKSWWDSIQLKSEATVPRTAKQAVMGKTGVEKIEVIDKSTFVMLSNSLQNMLDPDDTCDEDAQMVVALHDWESDKREGTEVMGWVQFYASMFEICDQWCDGIDLSQVSLYNTE